MGYGVIAHDSNSCINLLFPSHCPALVCTPLSLTRLAGAAPLLALLPLNSLPWSPFSEIQQREGSFQKQIASYHLLQKTLPQLPITFRIELRPPGMASRLFHGLAFLLQTLLLLSPSQSSCCSSTRHHTELTGRGAPWSSTTQQH